MPLLVIKAALRGSYEPGSAQGFFLLKGILFIFLLLLVWGSVMHLKTILTQDIYIYIAHQKHKTKKVCSISTVAYKYMMGCWSVKSMPPKVQHDLSTDPTITPNWTDQATFFGIHIFIYILLRSLN